MCVCVCVAHIIIRGRTHTFRVSFFPSGVHFPKVEGVRFLGLTRNEKSKWAMGKLCIYNFYSHC